MVTKIDLLDVLGVLKSLPDVLVESEASRSRRNAMSRRLIAPPPPGTPLLVSLALAFEHTGIYLGKNRVAELRDDGGVAVVSLTDFVNGDPCDVSLRTGTRIFAACDAKTRHPLGTKRAYATALKFAKFGFASDYDFVRSNCHLFTASCVAGLLTRDDAFDKLIGSGITSIGRLERVLARELNDGRRIAWCAVARSKEKFHYKLTAEKVARLRLEGKL